jgi:hypothetical protein
MKLNKPYRLVICSGRYQHIHKIHEFMINTGLNMADRVIVFIGEPNKNRSMNDPFTWSERKELIELIYEKEVDNGRLVVYPLTSLQELDLNLNDWCKFACDSAKFVTGIKPDLIIEGPDKRAMQFFNLGDMDYISELVISEGIVENGEYLKFRGTDIRRHLLYGEFDIWKQYVNPKLHNKFSELRSIIYGCSEEV